MREAAPGLVFSVKHTIANEDLAQHSGTPVGHASAFPARLRARVAWRPRPSKRQRAQGRPGAHRTHGPRATKKHAAEPQVQADHPAFPAQWFYGLYVISPVTGLFCHRRPRDVKHHRQLGASIGEPGPHDFAVRRNVVRRADIAASIASRPTFVTTRTLLAEAGRRGCIADLGETRTALFFQTGLDS